MELQWSVRDIVLVYECHRAPYFRELCRTSFVAMTMLFPYTTQRMRIHARLFSIDVLFVTPNRDNVFQDSVCQFCQNEIPLNSAATFVKS